MSPTLALLYLSNQESLVDFRKLLGQRIAVSFDSKPETWSTVENLQKQLILAFPQHKPVSVGRISAISVWEHGDRLLVFAEEQFPGRPGQNGASLYQFSSNGKPITSRAMPMGWRSTFVNTKKVELPDMGNFVLEVTSHGQREMGVYNIYLGFDGDRACMLRAGDAKGAILQNVYAVPNWAYGPPNPAYTKESLLNALKGSSCVRRLEALSWLGGEHGAPEHRLSPVNHEPPSEVVRFWSMHFDPEVTTVVSALRSSPEKWTREAATSILQNPSKFKPQSRPGINRTQTLRIEDLKFGQGSEFVGDRAAKIGDGAVASYTLALPTGEVVDEGLAQIEVGGDQVIEGLSKGLIGMIVGGERKLTIPADLGWGSLGTDKIPPASDLIYTLRLHHLEAENSSQTATTRDSILGKGRLANEGMIATIRCKAWTVDGKPTQLSNLTSPMNIAVGGKDSPGLGAVINNMRVGGVRRALISDSTYMSKFFEYEGFIVEVELLGLGETLHSLTKAST